MGVRTGPNFLCSDTDKTSFGFLFFTRATPKASHELAQQAGNTNCDFLGVKKGLITGWVR